MKTIIGEHGKIGVLIGHGELDADGGKVPTFIVAPTKDDEQYRRYDVLWGNGARELNEEEVVGYFAQQIEALLEQARYFGLSDEQIGILIKTRWEKARVES